VGFSGFLKNGTYNYANVTVLPNTSLQVIESDVQVAGNFVTQAYSQLYLIQSLLNISGSLFLSGTLTLDNYSVISVGGCVSINGSLVISDSLIQSYLFGNHTNDFVVMKTTCLVGTFTSISYNSTQTSCEKIGVKQSASNSTGLTITFFEVATGCNTGLSTAALGAAIGCSIIVFIAIVAAIIAFIYKTIIQQRKI